MDEEQDSMGWRRFFSWTNWISAIAAIDFALALGLVVLLGFDPFPFWRALPQLR